RTSYSTYYWKCRTNSSIGPSTTTSLDLEQFVRARLSSHQSHLPASLPTHVWKRKANEECQRRLQQLNRISRAPFTDDEERT
ncbi:hypothetical protein PENTCL1PPCAC_15247, partial [Pristionchus entomophagus]